MRKFISILLSGIVISTLWVACDDYQDETYTISDLDAAACRIYTVDTLSITLRLGTFPDTLTTFADQVAYLDSAGVVFEVNSDSLWDVRFNTNETYAVFNVQTAGIKVIYLYTEKSVNMALFGEDSLNYVPLSQTIDLETVAACEGIFGRAEYDLPAGPVLVYLTSEEPANFKMVVLNKE